MIGNTFIIPLFHLLFCGLNINWKWKSKYEYQAYNASNDLLVYEQLGYQLLNFNLFKEFSSINTSLIIGVKNLFDIQDVNFAMQDDVHTSDFSTISWGRTMFFQLSWKPF